MRNELEAALGGDDELAASLQKLLVGRVPPPRSGLESTGDAVEILSAAADADRGLEAVIERHGRPSLLVYNGMYEPALAEVWAERLAAVVDALRVAIAATGRVEVRGLGGAHLGTAWMIEPGIAVTNRHVAELFAEARNGVFEIGRDTNGQPFQVVVDFLAEADNTASKEVAVTGVLHIADAARDEPDIAFLQLAGGAPAPPALGDDRTLNPQDFVASIGYPAWNTNNNAADMKRIFNNVFDVKQLAPGAVKQLRPAVFTHDCSTLNGSSGSVIMSLAQQAAVGLHFSGREGVENRAVRIGEVRSHLDRALGRGPAVVVGDGVPAAPGEQTEAAPILDGRTGYLADGFLADGISVPCPQPVDGAASVLTPLIAAPGEFELKFHHFSSFMHKERKLPMFTAVNIDGSSVDRIKRAKDKWFLDPRIPVEAQTGSELYTGNDLDQGHLVRRLDPGWGTDGAAAVGDTFFYTNCAPQHSSLNRKTWLALEDYVLENATTHGFRVCVFTGPVFGDNDPVYRDHHRLPQAFWKVVVTLKDVDGGPPTLASSAYALSQADLVSGLEFAFGPFRTYQVPIGRVARWARLSFDPAVVAADAFDTAQEAVGYRPIEGPGDLRL